MTRSLFKRAKSQAPETWLLDAVIAAGQSLSTIEEPDYALPVGLFVPAGWTTAPITFRASHNGSTFFDLYDEFGAEVSIASAVAGRYYDLPASLKGPLFLRVRSGTAASPVNQASGVTLQILCLA